MMKINKTRHQVKRERSLIQHKFLLLILKLIRTAQMILKSQLKNKIVPTHQFGTIQTRSFAKTVQLHKLQCDTALYRN